MAISGVGSDGEGQAARAADFAIAIRNAVCKVSENNGLDLQIRIGLHIGPVVAGVIGNSRPAYDCWGDAVNVASRMESHGMPGKIHVSKDYVEATGACAKFAYRGMMKVKGKGMMETYFLEEILPPCS